MSVVMYGAQTFASVVVFASGSPAPSSAIRAEAGGEELLADRRGLAQALATYSRANARAYNATYGSRHPRVSPCSAVEIMAAVDAMDASSCSGARGVAVEWARMARYNLIPAVDGDFATWKALEVAHAVLAQALGEAA